MSEDLRDIARKRLKAKRDFWGLVSTFVVITIVLNVIWFLSGYRDYYWPAWPMLGFTIATFFNGINAFGPGSRPITDEAIDREIRKLNGEK
ncbi:2TM domain-containing protein [Leucobacter coleopterorum]|uniref:2TM domain-containing protein n=1 Tax=Leucobacter coleopterorum TaxID=2714933 RepID=A0ABX6K2V2_9MICO|nr:2TM domain-containing protein [Leucobacter coleopterorum]QIM19500.1 2TM domain-containing protein [Leucobacter coleopterorum]